MVDRLFRHPKRFCMLLFLIVFMILGSWVLQPSRAGAGAPFSAQGGSGQITINWTTANEWNNLG